MTVVQSQRTPETVLKVSTGEIIGVSRARPRARCPTPTSSNDIDQIITIAHPERSVSKDHLTAGWEGGKFWIVDLGSGNGTTVYYATGETTMRLTEGTEHTLDNKGRVTIGDQSFTVRIQGTGLSPA
jgi:pSer/pThr/pTyr-binding forkhead associated (FHA) protein